MTDPGAGPFHPRRQSLPQLSLIITLLIFTLFVGVFLGYGTTLFALYLAAQGQSVKTIALLSVVANVAVLGTCLAVPRCTRLVGIFTTCMMGLILLVGAFLLFPAMNGFWGWAVARLLFGAGIGAVWIVGETALNLVAPSEARTRILALYGVLFAVGLAIGPGLLALGENIGGGNTGRAPFLWGIVLVICGGVCLLFVRRRLAIPVEQGPQLSVLATIGRHVALMRLAFLSGAVETAPMALLPVYGLHLGYDADKAASLSIFYFAGGVVITLALGWFVDRRARALRMLPICAMSLICFAFLLALPRLGFLERFVLVFLFGGVAMALYPIALALLAGRLAPHDMASGNAAFVVTYQIGSLVGPGFAGIMMDWQGPKGLPLAMIVLCLVYLAMELIRPERSGKSAFHNRARNDDRSGDS